MSNYINEEIYNSYFGKKQESTKDMVLQAKQRYPEDHRRHVNEISVNREYNVQSLRQMADGNIDDIEQLADILKRLCNAAWGQGWGELSPDLKKGENSDNLILPQITLDINTKDIAEGLGGLKPILVDIIQETTESGEDTGDAFLVYRQWFDTVIEFNIYGRTNKEARQLQKRFENLITVYTGYLKRQGISEILYEREVSPKFSLNYDEQVSMRSIYYYIRFESITSVRQSVINTINAEIGVTSLNVDKVKTLLSSSMNIDPIEIEFFDGDNGITFK